MTDRAMGDRSSRRPFRIGLLVDTVGLTTPDGAPPRWPDILAFARTVEDAGFDSLWLGDRLLAAPFTDGVWESWSLLTALAATTRRVELVTNVMCTAFRNPALLAKMADTADEISGGRLLLGLGAGWHEPEFRAFGYPFDHRVSRFEEALHIIRTLLREGRVDFAGRFHRARECELRPRGPRPHGPQIMIGTKSERMLGLTARWADAWNGFLAAGRSHPDQVPPMRAAVDARYRDVGRDPATLVRTAGVLVDLNSPARFPNTAFPGIEPIRGSSEDMARMLRGFAEEGISHIEVWLAPSTAAGVEAFAPFWASWTAGSGAGSRRRRT